MPNTQTAKKALRQNRKRRLHNRAQRSGLRTAIKKVRTAVETGSSDDAQAQFRSAVKKLDQSAAKKLIHKNTAARLKSRLAKQLKAKSASAPPAAQ